MRSLTSREALPQELAQALEIAWVWCADCRCRHRSFRQPIGSGDWRAFCRDTAKAALRRVDALPEQSTTAEADGDLGIAPRPHHQIAGDGV